MVSDTKNVDVFLASFWVSQAFTIAGPVEGTTTDTLADITTDIGGGIGDCLTDTFAVSSNGAMGSPVICGVNTGQHSEHWILQFI